MFRSGTSFAFDEQFKIPVDPNNALDPPVRVTTVVSIPTLNSQDPEISRFSSYLQLLRLLGEMNMPVELNKRRATYKRLRKLPRRSLGRREIVTLQIRGTVKGVNSEQYKGLSDEDTQEFGSAILASYSVGHPIFETSSKGDPLLLGRGSLKTGDPTSRQTVLYRLRVILRNQVPGNSHLVGDQGDLIYAQRVKTRMTKTYVRPTSRTNVRIKSYVSQTNAATAGYILVKFCGKLGGPSGTPPDPDTWRKRRG
ncbi:hypothetical protein DFH09DRAFT_1276908 [Mycena vulgaris]|nr:hypothetical protein DFH09DRAFT_1276908 [Mycena vulgaris]